MRNIFSEFATYIKRVSLRHKVIGVLTRHTISLANNDDEYSGVHELAQIFSKLDPNASLAEYADLWHTVQEYTSKESNVCHIVKNVIVETIHNYSHKHRGYVEAMSRSVLMEIPEHHLRIAKMVKSFFSLGLELEMYNKELRSMLYTFESYDEIKKHIDRSPMDKQRDYWLEYGMTLQNPRNIDQWRTDTASWLTDETIAEEIRRIYIDHHGDGNFKRMHLLKNVELALVLYTDEYEFSVKRDMEFMGTHRFGVTRPACRVNLSLELGPWLTEKDPQKQKFAFAMMMYKMFPMFHRAQGTEWIVDEDPHSLGEAGQTFLGILHEPFKSLQPEKHALLEMAGFKHLMHGNTREQDIVELLPLYLYTFQQGNQDLSIRQAALPDITD